MGKAAVSPPRGGPSSFRTRSLAVIVVVMCLFATLVLRLWYLQVAEANVPAVRQASDEGLRTIYLPAPRGDIFSRGGALLAGNKIGLQVQVEPQAAADHPDIIHNLAVVLDEPVSVITAKLEDTQYPPYQAVPVATVSSSLALSIESRPRLFPGVKVVPVAVRYYPYGPAVANVIGFVSEITSSEYNASKHEMCAKGIPCYTTTSQVGQAGIEASMEDYLRGVPGKEVVQVGSQGQVLGVASYRPPVPGDNIVLSISLKDQKAAMAALTDWAKTGRTEISPTTGTHYRSPSAAMVVEDPHNGQILALATYPDYNDNQFVRGITSTLPGEVLHAPTHRGLCGWRPSARS